jgi:hypothetical protein
MTISPLRLLGCRFERCPTEDRSIGDAGCAGGVAAPSGSNGKVVEVAGHDPNVDEHTFDFKGFAKVGAIIALGKP